MPFRSDDSRFPILFIEATGAVDAEDIAAYLREMAMALERRQRHVVILDLRKISRLDSDLRHQVTHWTQANREALRQYRAAYAIVANSIWTRGLVQAVYWIKPPPFPHRNFRNVEAAHSWAVARL